MFTGIIQSLGEIININNEKHTYFKKRNWNVHFM